MRKVVATQFIIDPNKLFIPTAITLDQLQESYADVADWLCKQMVGTVTPSGGYILSACVDTITGGVNHSITAGNIYFVLNSPVWSNATAYSLGDMVSKGGSDYWNLVLGTNTNTNNDPTTNPTKWLRVGTTGQGQIFPTGAASFSPLVDTIIGRILPISIGTGSVAFTDGSTPTVHYQFIIAFFDGASGSGQFDFNDLKTASSGGVVDAWHNAALTANYTASGVCQYRKNRDGMVSFKGLVRGTAAVGATIFTLPAGYRPKQNIQEVVSLSSPGQVFYDISVATNGDVTLNDIGDYVANHPNTDISLTGFNFYID